MKIICVVGECYCGKSHLLRKFERISDVSIIHLGDIFRKNKFDGVCVDEKTIANVVSKTIMSGHFHDNIVIDNAFKTVEQAKAILKMAPKDCISIWWVSNKRTDVDYSSRGREDDANIEAKIKLWRENETELRKYIEDNGFEIQDIYNTNEGFLFK